MAHPPDTSDAYEVLHGFALGDEQRARLRAYLEAVLDENLRVNITATSTDSVEAGLATLQLPSYALVSGWNAADAPRLVIDIGSGNGFPGVVAAVHWPAARVLMIERRQKKAAAITRCLRVAHIGNADVLAEDARESAAHRPELLEAADLVMARGVGPLAVVNRLAAPFLAPGGRVLHWKATNTSPDELREGDESAAGFGWSARSEWSFDVPPGPGRLVGYRRPAAPPK